ncbi:MAG: peroxiredoxin [Xanthobacteraceae bacterium]
MSKKTHKKASKPKAGAKAGVKAKTSAKKAVSTAAKAGAKTGAKVKSKPGSKSKSGSSTVAVRKAPVAKAAKKAASGPAKSSSKAKVSAKKVVAKAPAATKSRAAIREAVKLTSPESARYDIKPDHAGSGLTVGSKVPAFQLPRDGGATMSLDSFAGRKLVLFFYPRASTPGCTKEAMDFSRLSGAFAALDTDVVGVSADPQRAQETFRDKHDLTVPLLSDEAHTVLEKFGVWGDKSLYGKIFQGIIRTTVLVGPDGRVINIWRNVKVDGHADAVLSYIENL